MSRYIDETSQTAARQIGRRKESFPFDFLADRYAKNTARRYRQPGSAYTGPRTIDTPISFSNYLVQSEDFSTTWASVAVTVSTNQLANPQNGVVSADLALETSATSGHAVTQGIAYTAVPHIFSVCAKANGRNWVAFNDGGSALAYFNLSTGVVGTVANCTSTIIPLGNGWYRCSMLWTPSAGAGTVLVYFSTDGSSISYTGDTTKGVYLWGAQMEHASVPGAYVQTVAATASVSAPSTDQFDANTNPDPFAFLVYESSPEDGALDLGLCEFNRLYARIPATQVQYTSRTVSRPVMDDVFSGSSYAVSFDNGVTSSRFDSRSAISVIGTLPTPQISVTATRPFVLAAITPDTWPIANVTIKGGSGTQVFSVANDASSIKSICETGTGLTVSVVKTYTAITISILTGTLAFIECTDSGVSLEPGSAGFTVVRLQTTSRTEGTETVTQTENLTPPTSTRSFTCSASHGGSAGQQIVFWNGNRIVARSIAATASGSVVTCPIDDVPGKDFFATHVGFAPLAAVRYVNGQKNCSIKRTTLFYMPGYTSGITTGADIPNFPVYTDPTSWLGVLVAGTAYAAIEVSAIEFWPVAGPIYQQTTDEVQMSDAIDTITP